MQLSVLCATSISSHSHNEYYCAVTVKFIIAEYIGIIKFPGSQFSWIVLILQVHGEVSLGILLHLQKEI